MLSKAAAQNGLLIQMLVAIALGVAIGILFPDIGVALNALPTAFIKLVRLVVGIIVFVTVAVGVARLGNMQEVGRLAIKSLAYFEAVTTIALGCGTLIGNLIAPGKGMHLDPATIDTGAIAAFTAQAQQHHGVVDFILGIIPSNPVGPFLEGNVLQVLVMALLVGFGMTRLGERKAPLVDALESVSRLIFVIVGAIMRLAPLAVLGAMAFITGRYGVGTLASLAGLVGTIYLACILFIAVVFAGIARWSGFSLWKFMLYLREEIILAFATASSEAVLPRLIAKLDNIGCSTPVVGFVLPTGYSFNLDGGSLYLTITALFIAQAFDIHLSIGDQLALIGIFLLTSKGIAGVAGAGIVVLASSLLMTPKIPLAGLALALSVDRLSDPMRTVTNMVGNALATMVVARWEGGRDDIRMQQVLDATMLPDDTYPPERSHPAADGE